MITEEQTSLVIQNIIKDSKLITESRLISESSLNRILGKHYNGGFIILTSYRAFPEKNTVNNNKDFYELKKEVRNNGFSFIPVYGGFIEDLGTVKEKEVKEPALLIPNQKVGSIKSYEDDANLFKLGVDLINKYNQDSFLYKPVGDNNETFYIDKSGKVEMKFTNKTINDLVSIYFTDLSKKQTMKDGSQTTKRFTFNENKYINRSPVGVSESISRYGEQFFSN